ncbi:ABC transporter permease [Candidatus Bipolaricaulota bacterium]|nr:ABC transporter permease [Candidatus Bipolaricaulota bacterium]
MLRYVFKRIVSTIPVIFLISVLVFLFLHLIPGDPIRILVGVRGTPDQIAKLTAQFHLDKPLVVQYLIWIGDALKGDLGISIRSNLPVATLILSRVPVTVSLASLAILIAMVIAIFAGVAAAAKRNTVYDFGVMVLANIGVSIPQFLMGILLILLFALTFNLLPSIGYKKFSDSPLLYLRHMILPALALGVSIASSITRVTRSHMIDVLGQDYIRTARAKGVREARVVMRHALKNALVPVVTLSGMFYASTLGGTIIIEEIFALPGIGRLVLQSIFNRDYPVVQGVVLFVALINVTFNVIIDVLYSYLNPKIQLR